MHGRCWPVALSVSIGVTLCEPNERPEAALGRADRAMYQAKGEGRNRVQIWGAVTSASV